MADALDDILLKQQQDEANFNSALRPMLLQKMGLVEERGGSWQTIPGYDKPQWVSNGKTSLRPMTEQERYNIMTPEERSSYDLEKLASERAVKAAAGTLDIDPTVKAQLGEQKAIADSLIRQRLGPTGLALSTPGIKSNSLTQANALNVLNAFGHGEEASGLNLLSQGQANLTNQANQFNQNAGLFTTGGTALPGMYQGANTVNDNLASLARMGDTFRKQQQVQREGALLNLAGTGAGLLMLA